MINALLVMTLLGQDLTGHGRRIEKEYELTVTGKGLKDRETVSLRFRRIANRLNWEDGALLTVALDDEHSRTAVVGKDEFIHRERFATAGEVEVQVDEARRIFRTSSLPEEAFAISSAAKRFDSALRGLRLIIDDVDAMKGEMCPAARKQAQVRKRIDWRRKTCHEEVADSFLTASAHAFGLLMTDVENALELDRAGKDATAMVSSLTGRPFVWEEAREQVATIESASLRERALLIVRTAAAVAKEVTSRVSSGDSRSWPRAEKEFIRTIDALREAGGGLEDVGGLLKQVEDYVHAGAGRLLCTRPDDGSLADIAQSIADRLAMFEQRIRTQH